MGARTQYHQFMCVSWHQSDIDAMLNEYLMNIDPRIFLIRDIYDFMIESMYDFIFFPNN